MDKIEKFLLNIVDEAWMECTESTEVPSTDWALRIIAKANVDNLLLTEASPIKIEGEVEEKICTWKRVDNSLMGFHDYEYHTTCNKSFDLDKIMKLAEIFPNSKMNFCPNCGGKIEL